MEFRGCSNDPSFQASGNYQTNDNRSPVLASIAQNTPPTSTQRSHVWLPAEVDDNPYSYPQLMSSCCQFSSIYVQNPQERLSHLRSANGRIRSVLDYDSAVKTKPKRIDPNITSLYPNLTPSFVHENSFQDTTAPNTKQNKRNSQSSGLPNIQQTPMCVQKNSSGGTAAPSTRQDNKCGQSSALSNFQQTSTFVQENSFDGTIATYTKQDKKHDQSGVLPNFQETFMGAKDNSNEPFCFF